MNDSANPSPDQARAQRRHLVQTAEFLDSQSAGLPVLPPVSWRLFEALPPWALKAPRALRHQALVTGALYAAPELRLCLEARVLRGVARLIGREAFCAVLDATGLPDHDPGMLGEGFVPSRFYARSAAFLVAGSDDAQLRTTLALVLRASPTVARSPLRPAATAAAMARRAHDILLACHGAPGADTRPGHLA